MEQNMHQDLAHQRYTHDKPVMCGLDFDIHYCKIA